MPASDLYRVPDGLPTGLAGLAEPASIAMQAVLRGRSEKGERALVLGCGLIGMLATLHLTSLGVDVVAADTVAARADFARRYWAVEAVVTPGGALPAEPSLVIEATGAPAAVTAAVDAVASAGRVVRVGISDRPVTLSMRTLGQGRRPAGQPAQPPPDGDALDLLAGHRDAAAALVTRRLPFERVGEAFGLLRTGLVGRIAVELAAVDPVRGG